MYFKFISNCTLPLHGSIFRKSYFYMGPGTSSEIIPGGGGQGPRPPGRWPDLLSGGVPSAISGRKALRLEFELSTPPPAARGWKNHAHARGRGSKGAIQPLSTQPHQQNIPLLLDHILVKEASQVTKLIRTHPVNQGCC